MNSRTRMLRMPIACGDSSVSGTMKVVSSTSHSEMPSTPRWKWMPERRDPDLVRPPAGSRPGGVEVGQDRAATRTKVTSAISEAEAAVDRLLLARHQHHQDGAERAAAA